MSRLGDIRIALAENLESITGIEASPYALANPTPPGFQIVPGDWRYDLAMQRGLDELSIIVQAFVAFTSDTDSQQLLDELLDPDGERSVKQAVESDPTLGGLVDDLQVTETTGYRVFQRSDNTAMLTADWNVTIYLGS